MLTSSDAEQPTASASQVSTSSCAVRSPAPSASGARGKRRTEAARSRNLRLQNERRNPIRSIKERLAGGRSAFYRLPPEQRAVLLEQAKSMFEAGMRTDPNRVFADTDRRGYVYMMANPAWPGLVKIGSAADPRARLATFNTGCPYRAFVILQHVRSNNRLEAERKVHTALAAHRLPGGEWFSVDMEDAARELFVVEEYEWEDA